MNARRLLKNPDAYLTVVMSATALAIVLFYAATHGTAPQSDEGAATVVWQLLMAGQIPIIAFFALTRLPNSPRQAVPILALQVGLALAAMAPVFLLRW